MSLEGKVALVTGSGRNIGRSIALALAEQGADVVVNARSNQAEAEAVAAEVGELGRKGLPLLADVGDRQQLEALLDTALAEFGRLDVVVNNAATRPSKSFSEMTYDDWRGVLATDLDSAFLTTKAALPGMLERGWGAGCQPQRVAGFSGPPRRSPHLRRQGRADWTDPGFGYRTRPQRYPGQLHRPRHD